MQTMVGQAVRSTLKHMMNAEYTDALTALSPALDETAKRYYGVSRISRVNSIRFLDEHRELITKIGLNDQGIGNTMMYFPPLDLILCKQHSFGEIIYCLMKQRRVHRSLTWMRDAGFAINSENQLYTDPMLLSGIIVSIVGCPVNKDDRIENRYWLPSAALQDPINDLWGKAEQIKQRVLDRA